MKQHISVFSLFVRSSIYKILLILLVMCVLQCGMFYFRFQEATTVFDAGIGTADHMTDGGNEIHLSTGGSMTNLESLITRSFIPQIFAVTFLLVTLFLCLPGTEYSSQCGYTLERLSIGEFQIFLHQAAYNLLIYIFLAAVQIAVSFALCSYYAANAPEIAVSSQTVFLAFYRSDFLHAILPLDEAALWVRNIFGGITLALAAAEFPYKQRRRTFGGAILAFAVFNLVFFTTGIGEGKAIVIYFMCAIIILCEIIYTLFFKEAVDAL